MLETLYTLQFILYAWDDEESCKIATKLRFDRRCLDPDMPDYTDDVDDVDDDEQYQYWGARLLVLAEVTDTPKADQRTWRSITGKRRGRKEHIMVILAILTLIVSVITAVIGPWMQSQEKESVVTLDGQTCNISIRDS